MENKELKDQEQQQDLGLEQEPQTGLRERADTPIVLPPDGE